MNKGMILNKVLCATILSASLSGISASPLIQDDSLEPDLDPIVVKHDAKTYPGINCEAQAVVEIDQFSNVQFDTSNANPGKRTVV